MYCIMYSIESMYYIIGIIIEYKSGLHFIGVTLWLEDKKVVKYDAARLASGARRGVSDPQLNALR